MSVAAAVDTFKKFAEIPRVSSAEIYKVSNEEQAYNVDLVFSSKLYARMAKTTQRCHLKVKNERMISSFSSPAVDTSSDTVKACFSSLPGSQSRWTVILRELPEKAGKIKRFVELWKEERCFESADVTEHHGSFVNHDNYGSLSIYDDNILYSAEASRPEKEVDIAARKDDEWPSSWDYEPDLGEQSGDLKRPTVFLLQFNLFSEEAPRLSRLSVDDDESDATLSSAIFGQAVFSSTGKEIFLTAYPTIQDGRRLGLIYCTSKPSAIYKASIEKDCGGKVVSARSPRSIKGKIECIWLQCQEGGAHKHCDALASYTNEQVSIEVPVVAIPDEASGWAGLYSDTQLPRSCLLRRGSFFVTDTINSCRKIVVLHKLGSNVPPKELTPNEGDIVLVQSAKEKNLIWSYRLLCTDGEDTMLVVRSSYFHPEQILIGKLQQDNVSVEWSIIYNLGKQWEEDKDIKRLDELMCSVEDIVTTKLETKGDQAVQAIIIRTKSPSRRKLEPCVLQIHGGPHGSDLIQWGPGTTALCLAGYTVVLPNYHGSLGRGEQFIESLIGQCGSLDVQDCVSCVNHLIEKKIADKGNLIVMGGSHGRFLTTHLIGQHPTLFQRAITRNPVIAVGQMEATSDIPEWCYSEFGFPFSFQTLPPHCPTLDQYEKMQAASPIHYIDSIQTPLLLLLGLKDQRVPPNQGKLLYHGLLARKKKVKMLTFENDQHALDSIEAELISWQASLRFIT